jgi:hypothetical protein
MGFFNDAGKLPCLHEFRDCKVFYMRFDEEEDFASLLVALSLWTLLA